MRKQKIFSVLTVCLLALGLALALTSCELFEEETTNYLNFRITNNHTAAISLIEVSSDADTGWYEPDDADIPPGTSKTFKLVVADKEKGANFEIRVFMVGQPGSAATTIRQADNVTFRLTLNADGTLTRN
jgi:hypothetical protein